MVKVSCRLVRYSSNVLSSWVEVWPAVDLLPSQTHLLSAYVRSDVALHLQWGQRQPPCRLNSTIQSITTNQKRKRPWRLSCVPFVVAAVGGHFQGNLGKSRSFRKKCYWTTGERRGTYTCNITRASWFDSHPEKDAVFYYFFFLSFPDTDWTTGPKPSHSYSHTVRSPSPHRAVAPTEPSVAPNFLPC